MPLFIVCNINQLTEYPMIFIIYPECVCSQHMGENSLFGFGSSIMIKCYYSKVIKNWFDWMKSSGRVIKEKYFNKIQKLLFSFPWLTHSACFFAWLRCQLNFCQTTEFQSLGTWNCFGEQNLIRVIISESYLIT